MTSDAFNPESKSGEPGKSEVKKKFKRLPLYDTPINQLVQNLYLESRLVSNGLQVELDAKHTLKFGQADEGWTVQLGEDLKVIPRKGGNFAFDLKGEGDKTRKIHIAVYPDKLDRLHYSGGHGLRARIKSRDVVFIDENFNGKYFEEGIDSVQLDGDARFATPFTQPMVLDNGTYEFKVEDTGKKTYLYFAWEKYSTSKITREVHQQLNDMRLDFGLLAATCDEEWSEHAKAHCEYMLKNDYFGHAEDPEKPGYTAKGHEAGMTSVLARGEGSAEDSVFAMFDTPLHGFHLRSPSLARTAIGRIREHTAIKYAGFDVEVPRAMEPMVFPPNDSENIPIKWPGKESPDPMVNAGVGMGYPITIHWPIPIPPGGSEGPEMKAVPPIHKTETGVYGPIPDKLEFVLELRAGKTWREIPCQVSYSKETVSKEMQAMGLVMTYALPHEPLMADELYRIRATWTYGEESKSLESCFRTGSDRAGHKWETNQRIEK